MTVAHKTQKAGGSCGAANNKMKGGSAKKSQMGGNKHENKMKGGSKKATKKSGKVSSNQAYCFKCKKAVMMVGVKDVTKKTSKRTMKGKSGKCAVCGGKVFKIVGGAK